MLEIANWQALGPEGRLRVLEDLVQRMMRLERAGDAQKTPPEIEKRPDFTIRPFRYRYKAQKRK